MKAKELREKGAEEIQVLETGLRKEFAESVLKLRMGSFTKVARLAQIKRDIARILTLRKEKS